MSNPFEPPQQEPVREAAESAAAAPDPSYEGPWRLGGRLVARSGERWPRRCVRCNSPDVLDTHLRVQVMWLPAYAWLAVLLGPVPYVFARLMFRREGSVRLYLCGPHLTQRRALEVATKLAMLALLTAGGGMIATGGSVFALVSMLALIGLFELPPGVVWARRIEGDRLELGGGSAAFRASLPPVDSSVEEGFFRELEGDLGAVDDD